MAVQIVSVRYEQVDADHDHVTLVGYHSTHLAQEPIMLSIERSQQRMALGERFFMMDGDAEVDLVPGKCPVCGHEPYMRTAADSGDEQKLLTLPLG